MIRFFLRRLIASVLLIGAVSSGAFILGHLAGGDAATELVASGASAAEIVRRRAALGLDRPFHQQFGAWLAGVTRLDLGTSAIYNRPVADLLAERASNTALLAAAALTLAFALGLPVGVLTGARPRSAAARLITPVSIALVSCPPLVAALGLSLVAVRTGWLSIAPGSLGVPALALGLPFAAMIERLQSRATTDALQTPSLVAAAARGLSPVRLLWIHAFRQSLRPVLGVSGVLIGSLFGGSLAVEYIAAWPGLGRLMYDALVARDLLLVAGCAMLGASFLAIGNLVADLLRAWIDPRARIE